MTCRWWCEICRSSLAVFESAQRRWKASSMMTKHHQVMVSTLMMFYFRHFLFDCLKYTKEDNLLKTFPSAVILKSAKEFRFLAFIRINIYTIEKHSFLLSPDFGCVVCTLILCMNVRTSALRLPLLILNCLATTVDSFQVVGSSAVVGNESMANWLATTDHHVLIVAQIFPSLKKQHYLEWNKQDASIEKWK